MIFLVDKGGWWSPKSGQRNFDPLSTFDTLPDEEIMALLVPPDEFDVKNGTERSERSVKTSKTIYKNHWVCFAEQARKKLFLFFLIMLYTFKFF